MKTQRSRTIKNSFTRQSVSPKNINTTTINVDFTFSSYQGAFLQNIDSSKPHSAINTYMKLTRTIATSKEVTNIIDHHYSMILKVTKKVNHGIACVHHAIVLKNCINIVRMAATHIIERGSSMINDDRSIRRIDPRIRWHRCSSVIVEGSIIQGSGKGCYFSYGACCNVQGGVSDRSTRPNKPLRNRNITR